MAVVGAGYWGPNLARNFRASRDWDLAVICDLDIERAQSVADGVGGVPVSASLDDVLADPLSTGKSCIGYLSMPLPGGAIAHVHVNWLSPTKIRQMVIGGTKRTLVWDDLNPQQRISVYDRGVDLQLQSKNTAVDARASNISYRLGDTWSPALPEHEALAGVATEFAAAIREGREARTSGSSGLRVLSVLEAAAGSLQTGGAPYPIDVTDPIQG